MGINRYPGPKPFKTEEQGIFFGRDTDISEFYKYVFLHQIIILFGESGYGKSSLINAGIIPLLKLKNSYIVRFEIKFGPYVSGSDRNTSPTQKIKEAIFEKLLQNSPLVFTETREPLWSRIKNFHVAYGSIDDSSFLLDDYLTTDQSFWYYLKNFQLVYESHQFIFFFDQFEELFTYPPDLILEFKKELSDVLYSIVPEFYRNQEDRLDQEGVSEEFRMAFYQKPDVKIVFSIRSDRLSLLEDMKDYHPSVLKNCYELKAFGPNSALEAIHKPAGLPDKPKGTFKTVCFEVEDKLALAIINALKDKNDRIQPSTLQIICWQLEDKFIPLIDSTENGYDNNSIYKLTFDEFDQNKDGNIKEEIAIIFDSYYRTAIETKVPAPLQYAAFLLVEKVLVQSGQRIPFEKDYLLTEFLMKQFKIADKADSQTILDTLTDASLLKVERDSQGRMIYELGHDTLVEPISRAANLRKEKEEQQRLLEEAELEKQAALKAKEEGEKAKQQAQEFRKLKEAAETYAQRATARSRVAIVICIIAIVVAVFAFIFKRQADVATQEATIAKEAADSSKVLAENNLRDYHILQARGYKEKGDELVDRKAYRAAIDYYEAALQGLLPYRETALTKQLREKIKDCKAHITP